MENTGDEVEASAPHPMTVLFNQVRVAARLNLYYAALFAALALPDICSAMETETGRATGPEYIRWFDRWVASRYTYSGNTSLTGSQAWELRCSMLHQGRARDPAHQYGYVAFIPGDRMHNISIHSARINGVLQPDFLLLSIPIFCSDVAEAATSWLATVIEDSLFRRNYDGFMRLRENGIPGYVSGTFIS